MTDTDTPAAATRDPDQLPRHTTPTWEVELLISGVAVFAMLQLPGWLDNQMFALMPRLDADLAGAGLSLYLYLKSAALILAVTFALHLLLRAHWIALVGMHSVYPDGVRWEKLRMGPLQRELEQRRHGSAADSIERADNRATVVFAIGVMLASRLLQISVLVTVLFAIILAGASLAGVHANLFPVFSFCFAAIILVMLLARRIDRLFGPRLRQHGLPRRMLATTFRVIAHGGFGRRSEVMALLASHGSERRINLLTIITFTALFMAVTFGMHAMKDPAGVGSYGLFPHSIDDARELRSAHYDDQRDAPAEQRRCANALAMAPGKARGVAMLDCLASLHAVSLDGQPLTTLHYDIGSDARTERPALQAMIDVRALATGRHLLRIARAPTTDAAGNGDDADVIAFWR